MKTASPSYDKGDGNLLFYAGAKDGDNVRNAKSEFDSREYFIQTHYNSVEESLRLFAEDDLLYEPGELVN